MIFTLEALINSVAGVIKAGYPTMNVYGSATQQGAEYPCFFVQEIPSNLYPEINDRNRREIALDIIYVQERDIPNAREDMRGVIDFLDYNLDTFAYTEPAAEGETPETCYLRAFSHAWSYEDQELHYKITVKALVGRERTEVKMQEMEEENAEIKRT